MLQPYNRNRAVGTYRRYVPPGGTRAMGAAALVQGAYNLYKYFKGKGNSHQQSVVKANNAYKRKKTKASYKPRKGLKNQVRELKRLAESDMGTLTYRERYTSQILSSVNTAATSVIDGNSLTIIERVIAQLRYYDPAAPAALVTADGTTGTYQKEFYVKKCFHKLKLMNNYQVPCEVALYVCRVKDDTSQTPKQSWTNGLADQSNVNDTSMIVYPTDSGMFNDLWSIALSKKLILQPGDSTAVSFATKPFQYDPSISDSHALTYQTRVKSYSFMIVVKGLYGHDTAVAEVGALQAGVDTVVTRSYEVRYSAGADIKYVYCVDNSDTFTNGGVVSNKPVSDNQGYSVA